MKEPKLVLIWVLGFEFDFWGQYEHLVTCLRRRTKIDQKIRTSEHYYLPHKLANPFHNSFQTKNS
jgi:hypothetical protein